MAIVNQKSPVRRVAFFRNLSDDKFLEAQAAKGAFNKRSAKNRMKRTANVKLVSQKSKKATTKTREFAKKISECTPSLYLTNLVGGRPKKIIAKTGRRTVGAKRNLALKSKIRV